MPTARPTDRGPRAVRPALAVVIALVLSLVTSPAGASSGGPAPTAPPQLRISVDDGERSAKVGDELHYTVTVENLGAVALDGLHVTQSVPAGLRPSTTDPKGRIGGGSITWSVDLAANGKVQLRSVGTVAKTPAAVLRLASVGCAAVSTDAPPLVCASDSDLLPAGRAARAAAVQPADEHRAGPRPQPTSGRGLLPSDLGSWLLVLLCLGAVGSVLRWRCVHESAHTRM